MKRVGDIVSARAVIAVSFMVTVISLSLSLPLSLYKNVPDQQNMIASYTSHHIESVSYLTADKNSSIYTQKSE